MNSLESELFFFSERIVRIYCRLLLCSVFLFSFILFTPDSFVHFMFHILYSARFYVFYSFVTEERKNTNVYVLKTFDGERETELEILNLVWASSIYLHWSERRRKKMKRNIERKTSSTSLFSLFLSSFRRHLLLLTLLCYFFFILLKILFRLCWFMSCAIYAHEAVNIEKIHVKLWIK